MRSLSREAVAFLGPEDGVRARVMAYIDGFNFYCGSVKNRPRYKWLDLVSFCRRLVAGDDLVKVKYFTALVNEQGDPRRPVRQQAYWRALEAVNGADFEIIYGKFRTDARFYRIARFQDNPPLGNNGKPLRNSATDSSICIMKSEEKATDVNLAVHLVNDAWLDLYDHALVISNDSDLTEALTIATGRGKKIIIANPFLWKRTGIASVFSRLGYEQRTITEKQLAACQLPDSIPGTNIHKPAEW